MKLSGALRQRKIRNLSLRTANMSACAGVLGVTHPYTRLLEEHAYVVEFIAAILACIALAIYVYSRYKKFPDEIAILAPHLQLPGSMVKGGYNSADEPIEFWMWESLQKRQILISTEKRQFRIAQSVLSEHQWRRLIDALTNVERRETPSPLNSIRLVFVIYCPLIVVTHYVLGDPSRFPYFNLLAHGGYHASIAGQGELYRVLSYSWLHASNTHLWANFFALALLAQTMGKSFSNKTVASVLVITAISSGVLGTLTKDFSLLVGGSGSIMGAFGFLFAAQRNHDPRLNPLARIARQKTLYVLLLAEFCLSLKYAWYGGGVHLAGFATGFAVYWLIGKHRETVWQKRCESMVLLCALGLFISWSVHTYEYLKTPKLLVTKAIATNDPFQIMLAATALPDLGEATTSEVLAVRERSRELLSTTELFHWPIARTEYYLGNNEQALDVIRKYSATASGNPGITDLWHAIERDTALARDLGPPEVLLPAGPATAYLISTDFKHFARLKLPEKVSPVAEALQSKQPIDWQLIAITEALAVSDEDTYGVWLVPKTKYRTADTASVAGWVPQ